MESVEMLKVLIDRTMFCIDPKREILQQYQDPANTIPFGAFKIGEGLSQLVVGSDGIMVEEARNMGIGAAHGRYILPSAMFLKNYTGNSEVVEHFNKLSKQDNWGVTLLNKTASARVDGKLPIINFKNTDFTVDVFNKILRSVDAPLNFIHFDKMTDLGSAYEFRYNTAIKNIPTSWSNPLYDTIVRIPQMVELDQYGIAEKYNLFFADLPISDKELRCDEGLLQYRLADFLPQIEIGEDRFIIDLQANELILSGDKFIRLKIKNMEESPDKLNYIFHYHKPSKSMISLSEKSTEYPKDIVKITLPHRHILDPVIAAKEQRVGLQDFLNHYPIQKKIKAILTPLWETDFAKIIRANRKRPVRIGSRIG